MCAHACVCVCVCVCVCAAVLEKVCEHLYDGECVRARYVYPLLCECRDTHHRVLWHALNLHYV